MTLPQGIDTSECRDEEELYYTTLSGPRRFLKGPYRNVAYQMASCGIVHLTEDTLPQLQTRMSIFNIIRGFITSSRVSKSHAERIYGLKIAGDYVPHEEWLLSEIKYLYNNDRYEDDVVGLTEFDTLDEIVIDGSVNEGLAYFMNFDIEGVKDVYTLLCEKDGDEFEITAVQLTNDRYREATPEELVMIEATPLWEMNNAI